MGDADTRPLRPPGQPSSSTPPGAGSSSLEYADFAYLLRRDSHAPAAVAPLATWLRPLQRTLQRWQRWAQRVLERQAPETQGFEAVAAEGDGGDAPRKARWCPEETATPLSLLLYLFVDSLVAKGRGKHLEQDDLWDVAHRDKAELVWRHFSEDLRSTAATDAPQGSVWRAVHRAYARPFVIAGVIKVFHDLVMFSSPWLLEQLLHHLGRTDVDASAAAGSSTDISGSGSGSDARRRLVALGLALAMFGASLVEALTVNMYFRILYRISLHMKTSMIALLYNKALHLAVSVRSDMGVGAISNLQSNDAAKLWGLPLYLHIIWNGPFQIAIVMLMLVRLLSWGPALAGLLVTVALIPISATLGKALSASRKVMVAATDARVKLVSEVVSGVKAIKLYAWEAPYLKRISALREEELRAVRTTQLLSMINTSLFSSGPILVSLAAFTTYAALGQPLTAAVAFPSLALFNLLRFPIIMLPAQVLNLIQARVGLQRIQAFIEAADAEGVRPLQPPPPPPAHGGGAKPRHQAAGAAAAHDAGSGARDNAGAPLDQHALSEEGIGGTSSPSAPPAAEGLVAVSVSGGAFAWAPGQPPVLSRVDLTVLSGQLVMVVGPVGAGKSSLLAALLGEMHTTAGRAAVAGSIAYTQQDPWIQNATLRNNILMGADFEAGRYARVLSACALGPDLSLLPAGDASEIGEKGINLSGGQKHRVALARAAFAGADVCLLDDPLSAVDAHVGRHLMDECVCGLLAGSTRILVTHQLQYLPAADVVVVVEGGRIAHTGTYQQLLQQGVDFHGLAPPAEEGADKDGVVEEEWEGRAALAAAEAAEARRLLLLAGADSDASSSADGADRAGADTAGGNDVAAAAPAHSANEVAEAAVLVDGRAPPAAVGTPNAGDDAAAGSSGADESLLDKATLRSHQEEAGGRVVKVEERSVGRVKQRVYSAYLAAWGPHFVLPLALVGASLVERGLQVGQNVVLSDWSNATSGARAVTSAATNATAAGSAPEPPPPGAAIGPAGALHPSQTFVYLMLYFTLGVASLAVGLARSGVIVMGSVAASRTLHGQLLLKVTRLPMSFFDSQPTGRLLNRFTRDTESVDVQLASSVDSALTCLVSVVLSMCVVVGVSPIMVLAMIPLGLVYYRVQAAYIATSRELKRLDSLAFSPLFQSFGEALGGLPTIRAFQRQDLFEERTLRQVDASNRAYWPIQMVNRWLSLRLEIMGAAVVAAAAVCVAVLLPQSAGRAGLAVSSALALTGILAWMVRQTTDLEVNMNSVERLVEYEAVAEESPGGEAAPPGWPRAGAIDARDLVVRYRPDLEPVLKGLTFSVAGGAKVGVCGRTGCGKSTLMMALYRIVEPSAGVLTIDGLDTQRLALVQLRSRLSLVPQDPVIFSGSVRSNLDPWGTAGGDAAIWEALRRAGMDSAVRDLQLGLDSPLTEGGSNLSTGQRQLLCMARALLRASPILVLDEATSNVDTSTDALIQATIRSAFADRTVLTIAHRLHTIIDSDAILLLSDGRVGEAGSPRELLARPGGVFRALVLETSRSNAAARIDLGMRAAITPTAGITAADARTPPALSAGPALAPPPSTLPLAPSMNLLAEPPAPAATEPAHEGEGRAPGAEGVSEWRRQPRSWDPTRGIGAAGSLQLSDLRTESVRRQEPY